MAIGTGWMFTEGFLFLEILSRLPLRRTRSVFSCRMVHSDKRPHSGITRLHKKNWTKSGMCTPHVDIQVFLFVIWRSFTRQQWWPLKHIGFFFLSEKRWSLRLLETENTELFDKNAASVFQTKPSHRPSLKKHIFFIACTHREVVLGFQVLCCFTDHINMAIKSCNRSAGLFLFWLAVSSQGVTRTYTWSGKNWCLLLNEVQNNLRIILLEKAFQIKTRPGLK